MARAIPRILPARFEITPEYLGGSLVSTLDFPFSHAFAEFMKVVEDRFHGGKKLDNDECPPFRPLNTVLTALAPTISYAFEKQYNRILRREVRQMLVLGHDPNRRPTGQQISKIVDLWARDWIETTFPRVTGSVAGKSVYRDFLARLQNPETTWEEVDAKVLMEDLGRDESRLNNLCYRAIPALLASMIAGKSSIINGKECNWWLCREDDTNFVVVSDPYSACQLD